MLFHNSILISFVFIPYSYSVVEILSIISFHSFEIQNSISYPPLFIFSNTPSNKNSPKNNIQQTINNNKNNLQNQNINKLTIIKLISGNS